MSSHKGPYTRVYRETWDDERFHGCSDIGRLVYLYILTTPLGNGLGCFKAGRAAMVEDSRIDPERFAEGFDESLRAGLFLYDETARVVFIPKYLDRNPVSNPNGIKALSKMYNTIPRCGLKNECYKMVAEYVGGKSDGFMPAFKDSFEEPLTEPLKKPIKEHPGHDLSLSGFLSKSPSQSGPGGTRARKTYEYEYDGPQNNNLQNLVAHTVDTFKIWPQDQVEMSLPKLLQSFPDVPADDWPGIITAAHVAMPPTEPNTKCYRYLHTQVEIYRRERGRGNKAAPRKTFADQQRENNLAAIDAVCGGSDGNERVHVGGFADFRGGVPENVDERGPDQAMDFHDGRD